MKTRIKESSVPAGGWTYIQKLKDGKTAKIEALDLFSLFEAVLNTRMANRMDVGDVVSDVEDQICGRDPINCRRGSNVMSGFADNGPKKTMKASAPSARVLEWAYQMESSPDEAKVIHDSQAVERASICLKCPMQQKWETGCGSCVKNARRLLAIIRRGKKNPASALLHGCKVHGMDTGTAVFLKRPAVKSANQPNRCWVE